MPELQLKFDLKTRDAAHNRIKPGIKAYSLNISQCRSNRYLGLNLGLDVVNFYNWNKLECRQLACFFCVQCSRGKSKPLKRLFLWSIILLANKLHCI